ncbi:MAG: hypothetical protein AAF555_11790 [Verrucomicrobiota bacterium]
MPGLSDGVLKYGYNEKGKVTAPDFQADPNYNTPGSNLTDWDYTYDEIGNRKSYSRRPAGAGPSSTTNYTSTALNLYSEIDFPSPHQNSAPTYDADGNLTRMEGPQFTHYTDDTLNFLWNGEKADR